MRALSRLRVLDDLEASVLAALDPLRTQGWSLRVPGTEAYALGEAVAIHQRLGEQIDDWCITGPPPDAEALLRALVAERGHDSGSVPAGALDPLRADLGVTEVEPWDFRWTDHPPELRPHLAPCWLTPSEDPEVQDLLDVAFPSAALQTGAPEVRRWAGVRDGTGRLVACAADATSAPTLGFLSSITSAPDVRRAGHGAAVTAWAAAELVREHGRAGLWVNHPNEVARRLYDALGFHDDHWMVWLSVDPEL
ncbi:MAG TPA: GNAT family N-acetyltransferase [Mycobacteriales bacterium]|nr:GNAT family N-acetyltransferase [Mycobacteriales bacterium]